MLNDSVVFVYCSIWYRQAAKRYFVHCFANPFNVSRQKSYFFQKYQVRWVLKFWTERYFYQDSRIIFWYFFMFFKCIYCLCKLRASVFCIFGKIKCLTRHIWMVAATGTVVVLKEVSARTAYIESPKNTLIEKDEPKTEIHLYKIAFISSAFGSSFTCCGFIQSVGTSHRFKYTKNNSFTQILDHKQIPKANRTKID